MIENENLKAQLPSGKSFRIQIPGAGEGHGSLTQLNIWDYEISSGNVVAMSAGGFNVHGSLLSWSNLAKYVPEGNIHLSTDVYLPGKSPIAFSGH